MFAGLAPLEASDAGLADLARAMVDSGEDDGSRENGNLPAGYVFLGEFVEHDLTFDPVLHGKIRGDPRSDKAVAPSDATTLRIPTLDLTGVYGGEPRAESRLYQRPAAGDADQFIIGLTSAAPGVGDPTAPASQPFDLLRDASGVACIPDLRDDENLVVAQLHLALMRFHNRIVQELKKGSTRREGSAKANVFDQARDLVVWHYQWVVVHDFLRRVLDVNVLDAILANGSTLGRAGDADTSEARGGADEPFVPAEFLAGAFRFGCCLGRRAYDYNRVFKKGGIAPATPQLLRAFTSAGRRGPIPGDWVIDWRRFFDLGGTGFNTAQRIDPARATAGHGVETALASRSAALRNLLWGKALGLASAQDICRALNTEPMTREEIATGPDGAVAAARGFDVETPLWYYVLKEAAMKTGGVRLGPLGSRIVAETVVGLLERDPSSFVSRRPKWRPTLASRVEGMFTMADLLEFAGDVNPLG